MQHAVLKKPLKLKNTFNFASFQEFWSAALVSKQFNFKLNMIEYKIIKNNGPRGELSVGDPGNFVKRTVMVSL